MTYKQKNAPRLLSHPNIKKQFNSADLSTLVANIPLPFDYHEPENPITPALTDNHEKVVYSACLVNCGSRCPLKVHVKNAVITKISSEEGIDAKTFGLHPIRACLRGRSVRWRTYDPQRLKYPMIRIGQRGEGKFKRISWDDALTLLAEKLKYTIKHYGNESIYYQYASGTVGANLSGRNTCQRLLSLLGGYLNYHGTYSSAQMSTIKPFIFGNAKESFLDQIKHSDLVVMFGHNIAETRMSGGGQVNEVYHALNHSRARVVIIDPRYNDSVIAYNATWLPIIPGTDAALVSAIIYTLLEDNRIDDDMINRYCVGWDATSLPDSAPPFSDYKSYILGLGYDRLPKTAEWAERKTGIPALAIRQLARDIINAKAAWISQGYGVQRWQNGEHAARSIMILPIITGQFGKAGTNIGGSGESMIYPIPGLSIPNPVKTSIPFFLWTRAIEDGPSITANNAFLKNKDKLDVGIKFIWNYAGNVLANQHADLNQTHRILQDESKCEFILVWDTHMTASAKYADLLLPDVSSVENSDLINNSYATGAYHYLIRMQQAIKPLWENRPTYDVLTDLAEKLGIKSAFTEGRTLHEWIEHSYERVKKIHNYLPAFSETDGKGVIDRKLSNSDDFIALRAFRDNPSLHPLNTPSGKIEIYSESLAHIANEWDMADGDTLYPIPAYLPAIEGSEDYVMKEKYPLQLVGFHTKAHTHSTFFELPQLNEALSDGVWINPVDAAARNIEHGQLVEIYNDRGKVCIHAKITPRILPGVIAIPQGRWASPTQEGIDVGGCINRLTSMRPTVLAKANPQHTNLVELKARELG